MVGFWKSQKYSPTYLGLVFRAFASLLFQQENAEDNVGNRNGRKESPAAIDTKEPTDKVSKEKGAEHDSKDVTEDANEGDKKIEEGKENEEITTGPERPSKTLIELLK